MDELLKAFLIIFIVVVLFCIAPMTALWTINSLAESGGASFYIPHTPWNYLLAFIFLVLVRGDWGRTNRD